MLGRLLAAGALFVCSLPAVTIGLPASDPNCFPFGGCGEGTRYQQVYSASEFSGAITIGIINFFSVEPTGSLPSGTFSFSLSTSANPVDALDTVLFDNNVGSDNQLFGVFDLTGQATPSILKFAGTPFVYDPTLGDLLLDMHISGISGGGASFLARNDDAGGLFSRVHDFGGGFTGTGLVTEFLPPEVPSGDDKGPTPIPEPHTLLLVGGGLLALLCGKAAAARLLASRRRSAPQ